MKSELDLLFWTLLLCVGIASVILNSIKYAREGEMICVLGVIATCFGMAFPLFQILLKFLR